jgi:predicted transcriptional regulator
VSSPEKPQKPQNGVIQEKWGTALEAGFQVVPNILIRAQNQLGLDPVDVVVLLNLMAHWWEKTALPFIAPSRIARRMNVTTRTVERHLKKLEKSGFLRRCAPQRTGDGLYTRTYDLQPLVTALQRASKNDLLFRMMQQNQFEDLNSEEHLAATEGPQVQNNGDAEPVQRVASSIPTGEGSGKPSPRVAVSKNDTPLLTHSQGSDTIAIPARLLDEGWEDSLVGKACPVCHAPFEQGHQCKRILVSDGDLF